MVSMDRSGAVTHGNVRLVAAWEARYRQTALLRFVYETFCVRLQLRMMYAKHHGSTRADFRWREVIHTYRLYWISQSAVGLHPFVMTRVAEATRTVDPRDVIALRRCEF